MVLEVTFQFIPNIKTILLLSWDSKLIESRTMAELDCHWHNGILALSNICYIVWLKLIAYSVEENDVMTLSAYMSHHICAARNQYFNLLGSAIDSCNNDITFLAKAVYILWDLGSPMHACCTRAEGSKILSRVYLEHMGDRQQ